MFFENGKFRLYSRRGLELTSDYPEIKMRVKAKECILDGEIVVYNEKGIPDFNLIQNHKGTANYAVFDILSKDGEDLRTKSLAERKKILDKTVIDNSSTQKVAYTDEGKKLLSLARKLKFEGIMAKEKDSVYVSSRSRKWLKVKFTSTIDCVIIGYQSNKRIISSLLLGIYEKEEIRFIGKVGTGFNNQILNELEKKIFQD
jgi:bifunctional non-homologous end joining protein LigD